QRVRPPMLQVVTPPAPDRAHPRRREPVERVPMRPIPGRQPGRRTTDDAARRGPPQLDTGPRHPRRRCHHSPVSYRPHGRRPLAAPAALRLSFRLHSQLPPTVAGTRTAPESPPPRGRFRSRSVPYVVVVVRCVVTRVWPCEHPPVPW